LLSCDNVGERAEAVLTAATSTPDQFDRRACIQSLICAAEENEEATFALSSAHSLTQIHSILGPCENDGCCSSVASLLAVLSRDRKVCVLMRSAGLIPSLINMLHCECTNDSSETLATVCEVLSNLSDASLLSNKVLELKGAASEAARLADSGRQPEIELDALQLGVRIASRSESPAWFIISSAVPQASAEVLSRSINSFRYDRARAAARVLAFSLSTCQEREEQEVDAESVELMYDDICENLILNGTFAITVANDLLSPEHKRALLCHVEKKAGSFVDVCFPPNGVYVLMLLSLLGVIHWSEGITHAIAERLHVEYHLQKALHEAFVHIDGYKRHVCPDQSGPYERDNDGAVKSCTPEYKVSGDATFAAMRAIGACAAIGCGRDETESRLLSPMKALESMSNESVDEAANLLALLRIEAAGHGIDIEGVVRDCALVRFHGEHV